MFSWGKKKSSVFSGNGSVSEVIKQSLQTTESRHGITYNSLPRPHIWGVRLLKKDIASHLAEICYSRLLPIPREAGIPADEEGLSSKRNAAALQIEIGDYFILLETKETNFRVHMLGQVVGPVEHDFCRTYNWAKGFVARQFRAICFTDLEQNQGEMVADFFPPGATSLKQITEKYYCNLDEKIMKPIGHSLEDLGIK